MAYRARKLLRVMKGLVLVGVAVLAIGDSVAYAASNEGPIHIDDDNSILIAPNNSYGNSYPTRGRGWDYVVSNDNYTDVWSSDILVYSTTQNPTIRIIGSDLCTNNSVSVRGGDVAYSPAMPSGRMANEFRLYTFDPRPGGTYGNGISVAYERGLWNYTAAATCHAKEITLTPTGFSMVDPGTGRYVYRINALANRATGGQFANSFHVIAPTGAIVTQSSDAGFSGFGMQASYPVPDGAAPNTPNPPDPYRVYSDLYIPFGPDCTLTTATDTKSLIITDGDNQGQFSVQPRPFRIAVQAFTRSTGVSRGYVPLTWRDVGAGTAVDVSGNRTVWEPGGGNQTGVLFDFTVEQGVIYRLVISRVYYNNTLEFRLPYDGAHYYLPCNQPTEVRPVASIAPASVEVGETVTATASAQRVGSAATAATGTYTRYVWYDTDRDGVRDPTEPGPSWFNGGSPTQTGAFAVPAGLASAPFPTVSGPAERGGRLCTRLLFTNPGPNTTFATPNPSAPSCTEIGKKPKLQAANGDVVAGGTFPNGAGVCPTPPVTGMGLGVRGSTSTIGATTYSSFADYGVFSLGQITTFGTNGVNPATPLSNYLSYGNLPSPLGFFMGTSSPSRCINNPFAIFGPRAAASNNSNSVDICNLGADTILNGQDGAGKIVLTCGSPLTPGERRVVYVKNADQAVIESNITYADTAYSSIDQIPQMIVLSDHNITVRQNVTQLDGLYAAKEEFQTCDVAPRLNTCTQQLSVNGAVIAGGRVVPLRTFGAQAPNYGDKSEIFRLRPDVLLNQLPTPGDESFIRTVDQREVPARF